MRGTLLFTEAVSLAKALFVYISLFSQCEFFPKGLLSPSDTLVTTQAYLGTTESQSEHDNSCSYGDRAIYIRQTTLSPQAVALFARWLGMGDLSYSRVSVIVHCQLCYFSATNHLYSLFFGCLRPETQTAFLNLFKRMGLQDQPCKIKMRHLVTHLQY